MENPKKSRTWLFVVKLCVSIGLVAWILNGVDFAEIGNTLKRTNIPLLVLAFCLFFLGYFMTASRWRLLMSIHGVRPPLTVLIQSFMVGIFFNNLLPSTIGGDVSRMYDVWRIAKDKASAVSVVLVDRFMGVLALIIWASLAVLLSPDIRSVFTVYAPVAAVMAMALCVAAFVFGRPRGVIAALTRQLRRLASKGPANIEKPVSKILQAFGPYYNHNPVLLKALAVSLILQLNVIVHFWLVAMAMDIDISFFAMCAIIPCTLMIMMLPISVNAIGVREVSFVYFMSLFGVSDEKAIAFAWIAFMFVIFQGLLGGIVFALRRSPPDLSKPT